MSLLSQWRDELQRTAEGDELPVIVYYGTQRSNVLDELDAGASVVVTSYGTLSSEFKPWAGEEGEKTKTATIKSGLYAGG